MQSKASVVKSLLLSEASEGLPWLPMTELPHTALALAGFALAHAAWSISDTEDGELLCPLAVVESKDGARRLMRFEADTQEEAIVAGKAAMRDATGDAAAWAFAREA